MITTRQPSRITAGRMYAAPAAAVLAVTALAGVWLTSPARAAELTIQVVGMTELAGEVHFGLYDNEADFPRGTSVAGDATPVVQDVVEFTVPGLSPGEYAVAVYHDANGNGKHDVTLLSTEPYAFSQNAKARLAPPPFETASFKVTEPATTIQIDFSK